MSFEELAKRSAAHPAAQEHAAARVAHRAGGAWHEVFLSDVYPHWQGPLVAASRKAAIESATHFSMRGTPSLANDKETLHSVAPRDWLITEWLVVSAAVGVTGSIAYMFAGDENDGALVRLGCFCDRDQLAVPEFTKQWAGPRAKLIQDAIDDVEAAAALFPTLLIKGLEAKEARLEAEAEAAREVEARRIEAEAQAEADAIAARKATAAAAHPDNQPDEPDQPDDE